MTLYFIIIIESNINEFIHLIKNFESLYQSISYKETHYLVFNNIN